MKSTSLKSVESSAKPRPALSAPLTEAFAALRAVRPPPDLRAKLRAALERAVREGAHAIWIGIAVSLGLQFDLIC